MGIELAIPVSGSDLREQRLARGLSQRALGEMLELHACTILRLEAARRLRRVDALAAAAVLAVPSARRRLPKGGRSRRR